MTNAVITKDVEPAELVFAMEATEHVFGLMAFIRPVLEPKTCKFYVDGSSFTIDSIDHFKNYMNGSTKISNRDYKRFFCNELKTLGFYQSFDSKRFDHPRFYNGRPNVLVREGAVPYEALVKKS